MRWSTFRTEQGTRVGVVGPNGSLYSLAPGAQLVDLIGDGVEGLHKHGEQALREPADIIPLSDVQLMAPIPNPPAVRDCLCFLDHMRNCLRVLGQSTELDDVWYRRPAFYFANPSSVIGPNDDALVAPGSGWFDVELEVAAIVGRGGRDLTPAEAADCIVGYTFYADWSARDLQLLDMQLRVGQGKGKDCSTTLGPFLVTRDDVPTSAATGTVNIDVAVALNGRVFCRGNTSSMDWTFPEVIAFASRGTEVRPGDVFGSGTLPTGCLLEHFSMTGSADFPGWLWDGDVVEFSSEILGTTRQVVRSSPVPAPLPQRRRPSDRQRPARRNPAGDYARGLQDLGSEAWAWLLPDGGYGWSNAGLVSGADASLLIDTLFDLHLTAEMLAAMDPITSLRPITHAVLTHSNGDHIHGNQLLADSVAIVAAKGTAEEFHEMVQPSMLSGMLAMDMGPQLTRYLRDRFGPFEFAGIKVREPDLTFDDRLTLDVGGREVHVLNLGPAHTAADSVVHVPDAGILYAGDLLFVGCTPVVWSGPIANWIAACDRMIAMAPSVVVPGHGPLTDVTGIRGVRDYLSFVSQQATEAFETGIGFADAARGVDLGPYRDWLDSERVVVNFYQRYRELDPTLPALDVMALLGLAAQWEAEHGR